MSGMVFVGWLQGQATILPPLEEVVKWAFYSIVGWGALRTEANGRALAYLKGNTATKDQLSAAVDKIRNDVTAANLEHRIAIAGELDEIEADVRALQERRKPRGGV